MSCVFKIILIMALVVSSQTVIGQVRSGLPASETNSDQLKESSNRLSLLVERIKSEDKDPFSHPEVLSLLKAMRAQFGIQVADELAQLVLNRPSKISDTELSRALKSAKSEQKGILNFIDLAAKKNQEINFTHIPKKEIILGDLVGNGVNASSDSLQSSLQKKSSDSQGQLYIFASFGLPEKILDKLIAHAITWRGIIVLRGFIENDAKKSQLVAARYIGMPNFQMNIDPFMFKRFEINSVPAFVMELPGEVDKVKCFSEGDCQPIPFFLSVEGDVSPTFAFDKMRDHSANASRKLDAYIRQFSK